MMRLKLSRVLADSTDSFEQVGWTLAPQAHRLACLIVIASALCLGLGACILGLVRQFALNSLLITSLTGACACLSMLWVALVFWLYRRTFSPRAVVNVRKLQHLSCAIYDGAGCFYYRSNDPTTEGGEASEWKLGGVKYAPEISNSMVIKVAFLAKCVLKLVSLSLSILRGVHIETGSTSRAWELMMAVVSVNALLLLDDVLALTLGGERSPCALIGKCVYRHDLPFQPVHGSVHSLQEAVVTIELSPWGIVIPLVHRYAFGIQTRSTWVLPIMGAFLGIVYTIGAIFCKGCYVALLCGALVPRCVVRKPHAVRESDHAIVKGLSYSVWGPFVELDTVDVYAV